MFSPCSSYLTPSMQRANSQRVKCYSYAITIIYGKVNLIFNLEAKGKGTIKQE